MFGMCSPQCDQLQVYCMFKEKNWREHNRNAICQVFYCVNDDKKADPHGNLQIMTCLLCYNNHVHALNPNTKERKGFITYYKIGGTIVLKKYVDNDHATIGNLNK